MPSLNIALSTDARGHEYHATLIASILRRTEWNVHVRCWCVGFLPESFEQGRLKVEFLPSVGDQTNKYPSVSGPAAYDRLLVIRDCPDWDRCMVMDYDQLVLCDLSPLFTMDMRDHLLAAHMQGPGVDMDYAMRVWLKRPMPAGWEHCGTNPYFLMPPLMNLKAMREAGTWENFLKAHAAFGADEQLSLTAATEGRTMPLEKKWNLFPRLHIAKGEVPQGVIHWSGWPKPWHKNADVWRPDIWEAERCTWEHLRSGWWEKPEVWEYEPEDDRCMKALVERGWKVRAVSERLRARRLKNGGYPDLRVCEEIKAGEAPWVRFGQWVDAADWMQRSTLRPDYVTLKGPMSRSEIDAVRVFGYGQGSRFRSHEWPAGGPMPRVMSYCRTHAEKDLLAGEELILRKEEEGVSLPPVARDALSQRDDMPEVPVPRIAVVVPVSREEEMFLPSFLRALQKNFCPGTSKDVRLMMVGPHDGLLSETMNRLCPPVRVLSGVDEGSVHERMVRNAESWKQADYVYLMRPQMLVQVPVREEVLGDLVAVLHPGFYDKSREKFTYEWRHQSAAYVAPHEGRAYVTAAWWGGRTAFFAAALERMVEMERMDQRTGIKAVWAEESYWNRQCVDHPPTNLLPPSYAWTAALKDQERVIVQWPMDAYCLTETNL
jgi:lipopolysaccharide biosynthesis glycosyltransferase